MRAALRAAETMTAVDPTTATLRAQLRESLKLPSHRLSGAGHQAIVWHSGILAKFIAASTLATTHCEAASWVHFVSDQDANDPFRMDLPVLDSAGTTRRTSMRLAHPEPGIAPHAVAAARAAQSSLECDGRTLASRAARDALARVCSEIDATRDAVHAGVQLAQVMQRCAARWVSPPCTTVTSDALLNCTRAREVLERILRDPVANANAFNAALRMDPRAAQPLHLAGESTEVPLWGVRNDGVRERIGAAEARRRLGQGRLLLPRAFLASGLMRIICDRFVHGSGGARYERVGDAWWKEFLGVQLPSFDVVTATLYPDPATLGCTDASVAPDAISFRRAWWDPTRCESAQQPRGWIEPARAALLQRIDAAPRRSAARRAAYRALTEHIECLRAMHRPRLASLSDRESRNRISRAQRALCLDRTWPFVLQSNDAIDTMAKPIIDRFTAQMQ